MLFIIVASVLYFYDYVENEGFNPSDEGVVQAQAYRIINGQIPHKDFISIRPVFSGIIHSVDFLLPLPLIVSGRWITFIEIFLTAFFIIQVLKKIYFGQNNLKTQFLYLLPLLLITYVLNTNLISLYPWTTIDALFLSSIGLNFMIDVIIGDKSKVYKNIVFAAFFFILAGLCRQTFFLLLVFLCLYLVINIKRFELRLYKLLLYSLFSLIPLFLYIFLLVINNSFNDFIQQITGRSEFFQTGIITFVKEFAKSYLLPLYLITTIFLIFNNKLKSLKIFDIFLNVQIVLYLLSAVVLSIIIFYNSLGNIHIVPFELFWINMFLSFLVFINYRVKHIHIVLPVSLQIIAWISSISLGVNSPSYAPGFIFISIISLYFITRIIPFKAFYMGIIPYSIILFVIFIHNQKRNNYRDLSFDQLNYKLKNIYEDFGEIKTNVNTYNYIDELKRIIDNFDRDYKIAVLPNNAFIYPVAGLENPLPLDWPQPAEFVGNEKVFKKKLYNLINVEKVCFIIDKYNSKNLAYKLEAMNYSSNDFDYINHIFLTCNKYPYEFKFFNVFISNGTDVQKDFLSNDILNRNQ
ncbi:MAG: hypothetical protein Kow0068_06390 [Marinilabiliales bacterium]